MGADWAEVLTNGGVLWEGGEWGQIESLGYVDGEGRMDVQVNCVWTRKFGVHGESQCLGGIVWKTDKSLIHLYKLVNILSLIMNIYK